MTSQDTPLLSRQDALRRRSLRSAWLWLLFGLLVPPAALVATYMGWMMRAVAPRHAWPLVVLGIAVFAVRLALYLG